MTNISVTKPTSAVLDGDIIVYRAAYWADKEGIDYLQARLLNDIKDWTPEGCTNVCVAMSCSVSNNFRKALWPLYKSNRADQVKPTCLYEAYGILQELPGICIYKEANLEADDLIGLSTSADTSIGVTIDKDLVSTPGWHWNPHKQEAPVYVPEDQANSFFLQQWLTGDSTDNIWGLWKWGPVKAKAFLKDKTFEEAVQGIWNLYLEEDWTKRPEERLPPLNKEEYALAQARSVRILRNGEFNRETKEVSLWKPPLTKVLEANMETK